MAKKISSVRFDPDVYERLDYVARYQGVSKSKLVNLALRQYLDGVMSGDDMRPGEWMPEMDSDLLQNLIGRVQLLESVVRAMEADTGRLMADYEERRRGLSGRPF